MSLRRLKSFYILSPGIDFRRQILTSLDGRFWRLKSLKGLKKLSLSFSTYIHRPYRPSNARVTRGIIKRHKSGIVGKRDSIDQYNPHIIHPSLFALLVVCCPAMVNYSNCLVFKLSVTAVCLCSAGFSSVIEYWHSVRRQTAVTANFSSYQLLLFVFALQDSLLSSSTGILTAVQRQTAVTAYFTTKRLLLFAFAGLWRTSIHRANMFFSLF